MLKLGFLPSHRWRRLIRVAIVYTAASLAALQAADLLFPALLLPDWAFRMLAAVAILGLPVVLAVVWATATATPQQGAPSATPASAPTASQLPLQNDDRPRSNTQVDSLAVLPFVNMSADPDNEFFSDGMTEELLNVLTKLGKFRVPARTSCFAFKGKDLDVREIGRRLGVHAVLEGSVRKSGDRVRISSQLIDVADGYHLWTETYDREIRDIFAIQDEIAFRIVDALNVQLTDHEVNTIRKVPTHSIRAYEYYMKGRQLFYRFRRQSFAHARELFERAIEVDSGYALAYAGVADCCSLLYMYWEHTDENLANADRASVTALQHDPELAEAHASRGLALSLSRKYDEAELEFERAIRLDRTLFEAYYFYGRACWAQGELDKAAELFKAANDVRPEDFQSLILLANVQHGQGRLAEEQATAKRAFEIIRRHLDMYPDDVRARYFGAAALIVTGEHEEGRVWLEQSLETDDPGVYYNVACGFIRIGDREKALDSLERAVQAGYAHRDWAQNDPDFAPLKDDARFEAILARMS